MVYLELAGGYLSYELMSFKSNTLTALENEAVYLEVRVYSSTADNVVQQSDTAFS